MWVCGCMGVVLLYVHYVVTIGSCTIVECLLYASAHVPLLTTCFMQVHMCHSRCLRLVGKVLACVSALYSSASSCMQ